MHRYFAKARAAEIGSAIGCRENDNARMVNRERTKIGAAREQTRLRMVWRGGQSLLLINIFYIYSPKKYIFILIVDYYQTPGFYLYSSYHALTSIKNDAPRLLLSAAEPAWKGRTADRGPRHSRQGIRRTRPCPTRFGICGERPDPHNAERRVNALGRRGHAGSGAPDRGERRRAGHVHRIRSHRNSRFSTQPCGWNRVGPE